MRTFCAQNSAQFYGMSMLRDSFFGAHAVHEWTLPSTAFMGLWDSLIYDTDVKVCLRFSTVPDALEFSASGRCERAALHAGLTLQAPDNAAQLCTGL